MGAEELQDNGGAGNDGMPKRDAKKSLRTGGGEPVDGWTSAGRRSGCFHFLPQGCIWESRAGSSEEQNAVSGGVWDIYMIKIIVDYLNSGTHSK